MKMKNRNIRHSDHWETPPEFYQKINEEFNFDFDPCPLHHDTSEWDGLQVDWGFRNFVNPPYSRKLKEAFILKAIEESKKGKLCVMLLPVSTSTKIFHDSIIPNYSEIRFVQKRIPFIGINSKGQKVNWHLKGFIDKDLKTGVDEILENKLKRHIKNHGQHDSMIVVFGSKDRADCDAMGHYAAAPKVGICRICGAGF